MRRVFGLITHIIARSFLTTWQSRWNLFSQNIDFKTKERENIFMTQTDSSPRSIFNKNGKTGIEEVDNLFERPKPISEVLSDRLKNNLKKLTIDPNYSSTIMIPEEQLGENFLHDLNVTYNSSYLTQIDPKDIRILASLSETNMPNVFLITRSKLSKENAKVYKTLLIQKERPTTIY